MLWNLLVWAVFGLVAGGIARLLVGSPTPLGCLGTIVLGVIGSMVGGFLGSLLFDGAEAQIHPSGLLGSIIGAVIVLLIWRRVARTM